MVHDGASVWFILECRHGPFPSCPHRAIERKLNLPKISIQLEFIGGGSNKEHSSLFWSNLNHSDSKLCTISFFSILNH